MLSTLIEFMKNVLKKMLHIIHYIV